MSRNKKAHNSPDPLTAFDEEQTSYENFVDRLLAELGLENAPDLPIEDVRAQVDACLKQPNELSRAIVEMREE